MSLIETALVDDGFHDPRVPPTAAFNAWGDHVGHTAALGHDQPVDPGGDHARASHRR